MRAGTVEGVVGPNGSGKSTLLRILATLLLPTAGAARVNGVDVVNHPLDARRSIVFSTGEGRSVYWRLTARQNFEFYAELHGLSRRSPRIEEVLGLLELGEHADRPTSGFSQGMQRRLGLARALLHRPPILLLDEPSRSLDPKSRSQFHRHHPLGAAALRQVVMNNDHAGCRLGLHRAIQWCGERTSGYARVSAQDLGGVAAILKGCR